MATKSTLVGLAATSLFLSSSVFASNWSSTEMHLQYGDLDQAFAAPGTSENTTIITLQHSSGWDYGGNFFFVDYSSVKSSDSLYLEWYPTFSTNSLFDIKYGGLLSDVSLVMGINAAPESDILKYLPGVQFSLNLDGFQFFNVLLTGYIDDNEGIAYGGAPKEDDSWMIDVAWRYPVSAGDQQFYIEGHAEYIDERQTEIPNVDSNSWTLVQVQMRWDLGKALSQKPEQLFVGVEYQYWNNKLGTDVDESAVQFLGVWRF
ncbi:hypothetical protein [Psychrosphaera haliotis]|uniref:Nucleoside-binding protein n=1 Tax=Psychrosphaera haliotis TaxID=555083 RepID=A0A6N8FCP7_9GAMM|nr:hypothetical protein [Psychrosphaera haliotis]MUH72522.1 hypothetical protein [Psychrosphaera haliotis]